MQNWLWSELKDFFFFFWCLIHNCMTILFITYLIWFILFVRSLPMPKVATIQNILDDHEEHEEKESRANGHVSNFHVLRFSPPQNVPFC